MLEFTTLEEVAVITISLSAIISVILVLITIYKEQKRSKIRDPQTIQPESES